MITKISISVAEKYKILMDLLFIGLGELSIYNHVIASGRTNTSDKTIYEIVFDNSYREGWLDIIAEELYVHNSSDINKATDNDNIFKMKCDVILYHTGYTRTYSYNIIYSQDSDGVVYNEVIKM